MEDADETINKAWIQNFMGWMRTSNINMCNAFTDKHAFITETALNESPQNSIVSDFNIILMIT
ncbi:hypothetical protein RvY_18238 [Ramazzottius varieornatus]|uniref:Uncharacterized protein n=1 Tax=Ramazzottius varieornatus TaxID=947166 RepID=A0A1D1W511_RAMVA|nr:hypothetical protein RvY_18238 [Ramazzottius varieornatus]